MTFFPLSLKALAITFAISALAGGAVASRPKSIDSAVLGSEWECIQTAFVITTCAQRQAVSAFGDHEQGGRSIAGKAGASNGHTD